ncbi:BCCT family transporter [Aeromonas caviae]|uniref:BCCT family transporter n=1 Tax=Aeromonas caviae TaxID=648 RepID=UPI001E31035F|nr:BCCT family transporter [Aeromonas caviae]WQD90371.1 BCCT family transporter [Aeromonas caviae]
MAASRSAGQRRVSGASSETRQAGWFGNWTLLYWAWWISWSPLRRPLHRPHLPRTHPARIHPRRPVRAHRLQPALDDGVRQCRHLGQPA